MDNIQLCYIDNEINKIDKMKQGDVIYKNGVELLVVLSYDHNEPCKGCFFYEDKACGSEKLIKCWDCKKEYIFTAIRKYNTTELCGIVKIYVINSISSILYEPIDISNTDKKMLEIGIALGLKGAISCIFGSLSKDDCNIKDEIIDISKHIKEKLISDNHG